MNGFAIFKGGLGLTAGIGASKIVKTIIDNHVDPVTTLDKILCGIGRFGIAMTASAIVTKHVEAQADEYHAIYKKVQANMEAAQKK